jgi:hypothetical protein
VGLSYSPQVHAYPRSLINIDFDLNNSLKKIRTISNNLSRQNNAVLLYHQHTHAHTRTHARTRTFRPASFYFLEFIPLLFPFFDI